MFIHRFIFSYTIPLVLLAVFLIQPTIIQAKEVGGVDTTCPLQSALSAWFIDVDGATTVNDVLIAQAKVVNNSTYTLGGVRVGIAAFEGYEQIPSYWSVLPEERQLIPGSTLQIPFELDIRALQAGEYTIKVYAVQGDEVSVLGTMINEGGQQDAGMMRISKATTRSSVVSSSLEVDGKSFNGQPLQLTTNDPVTIQVVTKNENRLPLLESSMLAVVTEGMVPLGTAVRSDKLDSVKLIPNGTRTTTLKNVLVGSGVHTLYAALLTEGAMQPIMRVPVNAPGEEIKAWSYISHIGLSDYPLVVDSEVVACVGKVGEGLGENWFAEELGLDFEVERGGEVVAKKTIYTTDVETKDFVSYLPGVTAKDLTLTIGLLQQRFNIPYVENDEHTPEQVLRSGLVPVDTISQTFKCDDSEYCDGDTQLIDRGNADTESYPDAQKSFWFYASVVISALLLMYLMLRRLPPESDHSGKSKILSTDELQ